MKYELLQMSDINGDKAYYSKNVVLLSSHRSINAVFKQMDKAIKLYPQLKMKLVEK